MGWILGLIALWLIAGYFYKGDGATKSQVPATPKEPPRRITIDDLAREYDEVFEWGDADEQLQYFRRWDKRTFVVRGRLSNHVNFPSVDPNPRVEAYPLDFEGKRTKTYVSLSLSPLIDIMIKSRRGTFRADFLFPNAESIYTLIREGCTEVIVQGTFSGNMTATSIVMYARKGIGLVPAIFTDCEILREF